jgi:hypothetical protein
MPAQIATAEDIAALHAELRAIRERLDYLAPAPQWVSVADYAARKVVTKQTVYRWIASGAIEARGSGKNREVKM